jgi:hypothetical protein
MPAGLPRDVLSLLLGFLTGLLSALFGIGGAIVSNPGLRALGAAPLVAVGTTLPSILPGAISGTLRYRREGLVDWRLIIPAAAAGLLAVVGGSGCRAPTPRDQGPRGPMLGSVGSRPGSAWLPGCCRGCWGSGVGWSWCRPSASCCRCR